jgi:hypothetical protein
MTGTSTAGAEWKGGGEIRALRRIIKSVADDDEEAMPAQVGHNRPPTHMVTAFDTALEEQAAIVARVLKQAETNRAEASLELRKLRDIFGAVDFARQDRIIALRAQGLTHAQIAVREGIGRQSVGKRLTDAAKGREKRRLLSKDTSARFLAYATERFDLSPGTIRTYISFVTHPETEVREKARQRERSKATHYLLALMRSEAKGNIAPPVVRRAYQALGPVGHPARIAILCWAISLEVGSEDPQEVARWFAAHRLA